MIGPARAFSSGPLPLLRRWRAWQLEPAAAVQQQRARPATTIPSDQQHSAPPPPTGDAGASRPARRVSHSDVVASVAAALERLGVRPGLGCEVCDGLVTVDIALHLGAPPPGERRVAVDVTPRPPDVLGGGGGGGGDNPGGPAPTPQRAWALAQARRQALKAHGWQYVQLPAVEFLAARGDADEEEELLRRTVLAAPEPAAGGGGAHVCSSGCAH